MEQMDVFIGDAHADLDYLEGVTLLMAYETQKFKAAYPDSPPPNLNLVGDNFGLSAFTHNFDPEGHILPGNTYGSEVVDWAIVQAAHYRLFITMGNHEQLDKNGDVIPPGELNGNELWFADMTKIQKAVTKIQGRPFHLINADLDLTPEARTLFRDYVDYEWKGKKHRVVGMVLAEFGLKTLHNSDPTGLRVIQSNKVLAAEKVIKKQMDQARAEGIDSMVFLNHDIFEEVLNQSQYVENLRQNAPVDHPYPTVAIMSAAHDHKQKYFRPNTHGMPVVVDGGSCFSGVITWRNEKNEVIRIDPFGPERLEEARKYSRGILSKPQSAFLQSVVPEIDRKREILNEVKGKTRRHLEDKAQTKAGPTNTGRMTADSILLESYRALLIARKDPAYADWFRDFPPGSHIPLVANWNSSSMRQEISKGIGDSLTRKYEIQLHPFPGSSVIAYSPVEDYLEFLQEFREFRASVPHAGTYTPQRSSNAVELVDQKGDLYALRVYFTDGSHAILSGKQKIWLPIDRFLWDKGYGRPFSKVFTEFVTPLPEQARSIAMHFTPLAQSSGSCRRALLRRMRMVEREVRSL